MDKSWLTCQNINAGEGIVALLARRGEGNEREQQQCYEDIGSTLMPDASMFQG